MKFEITPNGGRILTLQDKEMVCSVCGTKKAKQWYMCEQEKKLYCKQCLFTEGCKYKGNIEHIDHLIDSVRLEE